MFIELLRDTFSLPDTVIIVGLEKFRFYSEVHTCWSGGGMEKFSSAVP